MAFPGFAHVVIDHRRAAFDLVMAERAEEPAGSTWEPVAPQRLVVRESTRSG